MHFTAIYGYAFYYEGCFVTTVQHTDTRTNGALWILSSATVINKVDSKCVIFKYSIKAYKYDIFMNRIKSKNLFNTSRISFAYPIQSFISVTTRRRKSGAQTGRPLTANKSTIWISASPTGSVTNHF